MNGLTPIVVGALLGMLATVVQWDMHNQEEMLEQYCMLVGEGSMPDYKRIYNEQCLRD